MNAQERYQLWLNSPDIDEETKAELRSIANDPQEIEERFYMESRLLLLRSGSEHHADRG